MKEISAEETKENIVKKLYQRTSTLEALEEYGKTIKENFKSSIATEHTLRTPFENLLNAIKPKEIKIVHEAVKEEFEDRPLYNLRHTFASQLISKGADITWVSKMLGHKDVAITLKIYTKFIQEDDEARLKKIAKIDKLMVKYFLFKYPFFRYKNISLILHIFFLDI